MDFVLIYSIFVGIIFLVWLLFVIYMYHKLRGGE
jgi:hypothetical protein